MADNPEFYRARAAEERALADAAVLDNVRERCLRAESAWIAMATRAERTQTLRATREAATMHAAAEREMAPLLMPAS